MNVLRVGGEYLHEQESRGWRALAMITVALLLAAIVGVLGQRSSAIVRFLALAITVALLVHAGRALRTVLRRLRATRKGRLGEQLTTQLVSRLSDDYYLINDLVLARGNIDHVLVGPTGILVVETKRVAGEIACHGDCWTVNGRPVKSYSKQAKAGALAVKAFLATHHPELRHEYVHAAVVFTDPLCRVTVRNAQVAVVRFSELLALIAALADKRCMPPALVQSIARALVPAAAGRGLSAGRISANR
jgi:hypothetical protein